MKFVPCLQGTPEWLALRAGVITASNFCDALSCLTRVSGNKKAGDPTGASDKYAGDVAIERISGKPWGEPPKAWVLDRGHELEARARERYQIVTGNIAEESGIVLSDDNLFGYSTDGLVQPVFTGRAIAGQVVEEFLNACEGLIEIKCPIDSQKILAMWRDGDVAEYIHQMQGGMWLTGAKWTDFVMYVPDLAAVGRDLFVKRIARDDDFIATMEQQLLAFNTRVEHYRVLLGGAANEAQWPFPKAA